MNFTINKFRRNKNNHNNIYGTSFTYRSIISIPKKSRRKKLDETPMWLRLNVRVELQMNSHAKNPNSAIVYFHGKICAVFTLLLLLVVAVGTLAGRWSDLFLWSYLADFVLFNSSSSVRFFNLLEVLAFKRKSSNIWSGSFAFKTHTQKE